MRRGEEVPPRDQRGPARVAPPLGAPPPGRGHPGPVAALGPDGQLLLWTGTVAAVVMVARPRRRLADGDTPSVGVEATDAGQVWHALHRMLYSSLLMLYF